MRFWWCSAVVVFKLPAVVIERRGGEWEPLFRFGAACDGNKHESECRTLGMKDFGVIFTEGVLKREKGGYNRHHPASREPRGRLY